METVEILAGGEFANAVKSLGLTSAVCTYHYQPQPTHWREEYQVWLLSKEDFDNICAIDNDDWKDDWGWWRHAYGSNLGTVDCAYVTCRKMLNPYQIQSGLFFFEIRSHYSENCKGECWSCVILDQYIPHELEVCVLRPCVKSSIIRTKNYQIGWEANENAGNFDN